MANATMIPNRLINESSPYLLQHAHNPVDWWPWCEEAFAKAQEENKPVFLSVGYSTCHWCHVMAHESFEDAHVAEVLNRYFIAIKVDREQRPDIDSVYMAVCQALTGHGGWPMTVLLTPQQQPFFAGTYYTPRQLLQLTEQLGAEWQLDGSRLRQAARQITAHFSARPSEQSAAPTAPPKDLPAQALAGLQEGYDARYGGFGKAPKFPLGHNSLFLLACHHQPEALEMACHTLDMQYRGGIYDHLGGGFARYSTDNRWLVPHFEKMLYDNALLIAAFAEAYAQTGKAHYKRVVLQTVGWLETEMRDAGGAFYAAQDADSESGEGAYYVWSAAEIEAALGTQASAFKQHYGITAQGNFAGQNILHLLDTENWQEESAAIANQRQTLYQIRRQRMPLHTDDKLLTGWNALLMAALARAAQPLKQPHLLELAQGIWRYTQAHLLRESGQPLAGRRQGKPLGAGFLDDTAYLLWGLTELAAASENAVSLLTAAERLAQFLLADFADQDQGGLFLTARDAEPLIFRPKDYYDGALPSGNAVAAYGLLKLAALTGKAEYRHQARPILAAIGQEAAYHPSGYCFAMLAQLLDQASPN